MKRFKEFINETLQTHVGNFKVTSDMVINGKMIKEKIPYYVKGHFICSDLGLTTLEGCPSFISQSFNCNNNKLTNLKNGPIKIDKSMYCSNNQITSLEGGPTIINQSFYCDHNRLSNLIGSPESVGVDINCTFNPLTSLEGAPLKIGGTIYIEDSIFDLKVEKVFILNKNYFDKENYWLDLLKYMIDEKIELDKVFGWPKNFLTQELIDSVKGIKKFML